MVGGMAASVENAKMMMGVLKLFEAMAGKKINPRKSSVIFSKNVCRGAKRDIAIHNINLANDIGKYLENPVKSRGNLATGDLDFIIEKINAKLVG